MRLAIAVIALECALILPTVLLASRSPSGSDLAVSVVGPRVDEPLSVVTGQLRNTGQSAATNVQVQVQVFDSRYGYLFSRSSWLTPGEIAPGSTALFSVSVSS